MGGWEARRQNDAQRDRRQSVGSCSVRCGILLVCVLLPRCIRAELLGSDSLRGVRSHRSWMVSMGIKIVYAVLVWNYFFLWFCCQSCSGRNEARKEARKAAREAKTKTKAEHAAPPHIDV